MRERVLIVEPERSTLKVLESVLAQAGVADVIGVDDPARALEAVAEHDPQLVLLAIDGDGGLDSLATLAPWTGGRARLPVVAMSASGSADERRRAREAGAREFLSKPLDPTEVLARVENVLASARLSALLAADRIEGFERLARLAEYRDDATYEHPQRVGRTAALLAERLGLDAETVELIRHAATLHDVGKVAVPDRILLKPGKLTGQEFELMKIHTTIGGEILSGSDWPVLQMAEQIALTHHERYDGTGYPRGLEGESIPLPGRIVIVADNFDALTHTRPYAEAWDPERAAAEVQRMSARQFDPRVVEAFDGLDLAALLAPVV